MKSEHYFNILDEAIKNISSHADLIMFEGKIPKKDKEAIIEDCIILSCFYTGYFRERPPFIIDFIESDNAKDKLSKNERKQLGAYFTPPYIAQYICKNTIGPLVDKIIKGRSKDKVKKVCDLKICDPAMGGGIFLIEAHNYLMDRLILIDQSEYTIERMAKMSMNCIFGVDINPKAVEFSKMIMNLNVAKWTIVERLDEYVNFAEKHLN